MKNEKRKFGPWSWTKEDITLLKKMYPKGNTRKIADRLGRPLTAVRQKAYDLGIKTKVYQYWRQEDIELLAKLYPDTPTKALSERFERSSGSIKIKARQLGLKKSENLLKIIRSLPRNGKKKKNKI